jgi:hypothetical protein
MKSSAAELAVGVIVVEEARLSAAAAAAAAAAQHIYPSHHL